MDKVKRHITTLKNLEKAKDFDTFFDKQFETIKKNPDKAFELLQSLEFSKHSVGMCYILIALFQTKDLTKAVNLKELVMFARNYLFSFEPADIKSASIYLTTFHMFVRLFSYTLLNGETERPHWNSENPACFYINRPILGIKPLKKAIEKLQEKDSEFTCCHSYFALLCVSAKTYRHALPVITKKILSGFVQGFLDYENMMNYNYYRGLIFTALEDYEQAKHAFRLVLDVPYHAVHILQVCAFKKLVLLTWLTSAPNLGDMEHKAIRVEIKQIVHAKGLLGKHLEEAGINYSKAEDIHNFFIFLNHDEIVKDTNMGLVKQVIKKLRNEVIESLTLTNTMLGIEEIEKRLAAHREFCEAREEQEKTEVLKKLKDKVMEQSDLKLVYEDDDLHTAILKLIKKGRIRAKIDMSKNLVIFEDETTTVSQLVKKLESQSEEIMEIVKEVERTDKDLIMQKKAGVLEDEEMGVSEGDMLMIDDGAMV